jgi:hypothetical protein
MVWESWVIIAPNKAEKDKLASRYSDASIMVLEPSIGSIKQMITLFQLVSPSHIQNSTTMKEG